MAQEKEEVIVDVQEAYSKTERYLEENRKSLTIIIVAIVAVILGYFAWKKFYVAPREAEAMSEMFMAEKYFEKDSLDLAINGDGNFKGFKYIIEEYGITKSANLAHYYLGISYLRKGDFQLAIDHLKEFDTDDDMLGPVSIGATGDAYLELGKNEDAVGHYLKAAKKANNKFITPVYLMKAGMAYEELGNHKNAVKVYEQIRSDYYDSPEGRDVERYLARAKALAEK
jgi:tetratricopeptide (TPR) repeat protein